MQPMLPRLSFEFGWDQRLWTCRAQSRSQADSLHWKSVPRGLVKAVGEQKVRKTIQNNTF